MKATDLLHKTKYLLRFYDVSPKKRLGQNFAINNAFLEKLISYAFLTKDDVVLEVGAGLGFLTQLLSEKCKKVVTVEVDSRLVRILKEQLRGLHNVELIEGDIFNVSLPSFNKVVSTPPYCLSSPLLFFLLEKEFDYAVSALQEEFAKRLSAPVGSKDYSRLTVMVHYKAQAELLDHVPRGVFYPPPRVDSTIVRLKPRKPPFPLEDEKIFSQLVRNLFSQRNKKVRNAVVPFLREQSIKDGDAQKLADAMLFSDKRARELAPEDFGALANEFVRKKNLLQ